VALEFAVLEPPVLNEQRTSPRKVLKSRALVAFDGAAAFLTRTIDVGANGISVSYPEPIQPGRDCTLSFELYLDGKVSRVTTRSKALHCFFSNGAYKIGFQFVSLDLAGMTLLARFLR
jgi:hypothetical protein